MKIQCFEFSLVFLFLLLYSILINEIFKYYYIYSKFNIFFTNSMIIYKRGGIMKYEYGDGKLKIDLDEEIDNY